MTTPPRETAIAIDRLRLRGPRADRLALVASRTLPAALERALADLGDVHLDAVHVLLDLDPAEYDDETLAVLWADRIRAEVVGATGPARRAEGAGVAATTRSPGGGGAPAPGAEPPSADRVAATARTWLSTALGVRPRVPADLLSLADPVLAREVAGLLGPSTWARLVDRLDRWLPAAARRSTDGTEPPAATPGPDSATHTEGGEQADLRTSGATSGSEPAAAPPASRPVPDQVGQLAELRAGETRDLDPAAVTRAAGLVLLYPWLADHCRLAESLHQDRDALAVREAALASVLDDATLVDDPLVRLLAGHPDPLAADRVERAPLPQADEVESSAERVIAAFAALLPGFHDSTPAFVREAWLARLGVLDLDLDPPLLTAATHPLDVLLPMLPYPLGLLKLPWSPPVSVRFRP